MNIPRKHFLETKRLLKNIHKNKISRWLLEVGYYPEQYVVPPTYKVERFDLQSTPFFRVTTNQGRQSYDPDKTDTIMVSYPKTQLTERNFGIIHPKIYHDLVWHLNKEWDLIIDHLFHKDIQIYSYSFPVPITAKNEGLLGDLRAGRMIYEFVEMSEKDLVAEGHKFKFILKTDVKNFYPSIYTHSVAWALHTKRLIRSKGNRTNYKSFLGLRLDRLLQSANDGCTNGIAIGSAISDIIGEIILSSIDRECSTYLKSQSIDFVGVRFKDDYRFLCNTKEDGQKIIKGLQSALKQFNLSLNEKKSDIKELPEGLFREWPAEYRKCSLKYVKKIKYTRLADTILSTLKIDSQYPETGVIDKFLSELTTKKYKLKLLLNEKYSLKTFSLLMLLKDRRAKSFPHILAIIAEIININVGHPKLLQYINDSLDLLLNKMFNNEQENLYDLMWLVYFVKANNLFPISYPSRINSKLLQGLRTNRFSLFGKLPPNAKLFQTIKSPAKNVNLLEYLDLFKK